MMRCRARPSDIGSVGWSHRHLSINHPGLGQKKQTAKVRDATISSWKLSIVPLKTDLQCFCDPARRSRMEDSKTIADRMVLGQDEVKS